MSLPRGTQAPDLEGDGVTFSLSDLDSPDLPDSLPEWVKKIIIESEEYGALLTGKADEPPSRQPDLANDFA